MTGQRTSMQKETEIRRSLLLEKNISIAMLISDIGLGEKTVLNLLLIGLWDIDSIDSIIVEGLRSLSALNQQLERPIDR